MNIHWHFESLCDLDLDYNRTIQSFQKTIQLYSDVPSNQVQLQKDKQIRQYIKTSYFDYVILHCDLDLEDSKPIFLKNNQAHIIHKDASPYQVWQ